MTGYFVPFHCADCNGVRRADGTCALCGDVLSWLDLVLEPGERATTLGNLWGYTHEDACAECAKGNTTAHDYVPTRYVRVVFMQDSDEANPVLDMIRESGPEAAIDYLSQWDMSDGDVHDSPSAGTSDDTERVGDYILTWNHALGYVGLERVTTAAL